MNNQKTIISAIALLILIIIPGCIYLIYFHSPAIEWEQTPETLIITEERPLAELDYNYIPDFRVWGDGYIVWVERGYPHSERKVFEGQLSSKELTTLLERFRDVDFFKLSRQISKENYAIPHIRISLKGCDFSLPISQDDPKIFELVSYLKSGAGVIGTEFVPTNAAFMVIPAERTSYQKNLETEFSWPDEAFGYTLAEAPKDNLTGDELLFAWKIVSSPKPLVESDGKIYWIAVLPPKISDFHVE
jgi:hypothetical protein